MSLDDLSPAMQAALPLLFQGETDAAVQVLAAAVDAARDASGDASLALLDATQDLARLYERLGRLEDAIAVWQAACVVATPQDEPRERRRLASLVAWADLLEQAGRPAEALVVLARGVEDRAALFGRDHPGYAFGLEPLAELLFSQGRNREAAAAIDAAVAIFAANGHARLAESSVLRAYVRHALGERTGLWSGLVAAEPAVIDRVLDELAARSQERDAPQEADRALAYALAEELDATFGPQHELSARAMSLIQWLEAQRGNHAARRTALLRLAAYFAATGDDRRQIEIAWQLADTAEEADDLEAASDHYQAAVAQADQHGDPRDQAWIRDRYGSFLGRQGQLDEAVRVLKEAVALAEPTGDAELLGQALISLGIAQKYAGDREAALARLAQGVSLLPEDHAYAAIGREQFARLEEGVDDGPTLAEGLVTLIRARLPADFDLEYRIDFTADECIARLVSPRQPTEAELNAFTYAVQEAFYRLQERV